MPVALTIQYSRVNQLLNASREAFGSPISDDQLIKAAGQIFVTRLKEVCPRDTGQGAQSITTKPNGNTEGSVWGLFYLALIDRGTGIYGPGGQPIRPVRAKALHFFLKDGTEMFCKSVRGVKPMRWISKGVDRAEPDVRTLMAANGRKIVDMIQEQTT